MRLVGSFVLFGTVLAGGCATTSTPQPDAQKLAGQPCSSPGEHHCLGNGRVLLCTTGYWTLKDRCVCKPDSSEYACKEPRVEPSPIGFAGITRAGQRPNGPLLRSA